MTDLDTFDFDAEGFIDMDMFPDDGSDLTATDLASLREVLLSDTVEEPTADEWDDMVGEVVGESDPSGDGPFSPDLSLDELGVTGLDGSDGAAFGADGSFGDELSPDGDTGDEPDTDGFDDGYDLGDGDAWDLDPSLDVDPAGAALDDLGHDDSFDTGLGSSPTTGSDFEDLL